MGFPLCVEQRRADRQIGDMARQMDAAVCAAVAMTWRAGNLGVGDELAIQISIRTYARRDQASAPVYRRSAP